MAAASPQMLTANRLDDGDVLYWKAGDWVDSAARRRGLRRLPRRPTRRWPRRKPFVTGNVVVNPISSMCAWMRPASIR